MVFEEFLNNLRDATVVFGLMAVVDSMAVNTMKGNSVSALLGYARITAALILHL